MERIDGSGRVRDTETYAIIGAAMEVHGTLGPEFLEPAYQAALEVEFGLKAIPYAREVEMPIYYKGPVNYLAASGIGRGLLVNFGTPRLQYKRFVGRSYQAPSTSSSVTSVGLLS